MRRFLRSGALLTLPRQGTQLALQTALVHVAANTMVDLHHRRERALPETGDRADGELPVRSGEYGLVGIAVGFGGRHAQVETQAVQQVARTARVTRGAAAN